MTKKDGKAKLPKKVGGVKLPKQLRKSAGVMAEIAQNPVARDVVSAALVAGAAALARSKAKGKPTASAAKKPDGEFSGLVSQGQEIGAMISQGINAFVSALFKPSAKAAPHAAAPAKPAAARAAPKRAAPKKPSAAKQTAVKPAAVKPAAKRAPAKPRAKPGPKPKAAPQT